MCVYHDQPDMYDHLVEYCGASEHVQNNNSQTPLLLAASIGKIVMLQHIYNKKRRVRRRTPGVHYLPRMRAACRASCVLTMYLYVLSMHS